mgnify:FL=1
MSNLFDSQGEQISLGNKLGSGGEGAVFEVPSLERGIVAKVYHKHINPEKQAKLRAMAGSCDESLRSIAAWPLNTLHGNRGGPIRGFLMSKAAGHEPIHHLYGPSHRKQLFPEKDWTFLINAARNTAAAFAVIHSHGHVIGDVNPNLVFVAPNSFVKLIDCDSFQIAANGKNFLCEVGVPHFTPPELQKHTSFKEIKRTPNHDNFGLALLIFHILLMGRHPFSGVFRGKGDMPIEKAIAELRYAFGRNAGLKLMAPPPNAVTPAILPESLAGSFERAFAEDAWKSGARPTAREWVQALDASRTQVRACAQQSIHKYYQSAHSCPWCKFEQHPGIYFFLATVARNGASSFDVNQAWAKISTVPSPGPAPQISPATFAGTPKSLPPSLVKAKEIATVKKIVAGGVLLASLVFAPQLLIFAIVVAAVLFFLSSADDSSERRIRQQAFENARTSYSTVTSQWQAETGDELFRRTLHELSGYRAEYQDLGNQISQAMQGLQANVRNSQLQKYLERFFIDDSNIHGIGPGRKSTLASFGIETAKDVVPHRVMAIRGFGDILTGELVEWRKALERKFVFDQSKGVDPADISTVNQKFSQKRKSLEGKLLAGYEQLTQIRKHILLRRQQLQSSVEAAARQLAQAEADLKIIG